MELRLSLHQNVLQYLWEKLDEPNCLVLLG
jgi:hypothetical protein